MVSEITNRPIDIRGTIRLIASLQRHDVQNSRQQSMEDKGEKGQEESTVTMLLGSIWIAYIMLYDIG